MRSACRAFALFAFLLAAPGTTTNAQSAPKSASSDRLFETIAALDAAVFEAFNRCDLAEFSKYFAEDVEFYHDKTGLSRSRKDLVESVKNNICGKVRRKLVAGTLEVYPIPGFGAVETGVHRFYEVRDKGADKLAGEAKFLHIWQYDGGTWRITRVVSYDHEAR